MKKILKVTSNADYTLKIGGLVFLPHETKELIEDKDIYQFELSGENTLHDGSPAFKVKEEKITKAQEEKKHEKAEAKKEGGE